MDGFNGIKIAKRNSFFSNFLLNDLDINVIC